MSRTNVTAQPVKIGFIGPLSGDSAIIGEENLKGIQLAVDFLNSTHDFAESKIELIVKDDRMNERDTLTQYRQLLGVNNVKHYLTVNYGGFLALAEQNSKDKTIIVDSLDASEELANLNSNSFAVGIYDEGIGYAIADYLNNQQQSNVGIISNLEDPFILPRFPSLTEHFGKMKG